MNLCPQGWVGCFLFWVDIGLKVYEGIESLSFGICEFYQSYF